MLNQFFDDLSQERTPSDLNMECLCIFTRRVNDLPASLTDDHRE